MTLIPCLQQSVMSYSSLRSSNLSQHPDGYDKTTSKFLGVDLNKYKNGGLVADLEDIGLDASKPTLFVWEAVLFYVNEGPKREIFNEVGVASREERASSNYIDAEWSMPSSPRSLLLLRRF